MNQEDGKPYNVHAALGNLAVIYPTTYLLIKGYIDYLELRVNALKDEEEDYIICPNCGRVEVE